MIDLNYDNFVSRSKITKEDISKKLPDEAIFKYYIPNLTIGRAIRSPLKKKDDHPSFGVFYSNKYNKLLFKDQSLNIKGDCVEFVKNYFNLENSYEACSKIALDFGISDSYTTSCNVYKNPIPIDKSVFDKSLYKKDRTIIDISSRSWSKNDKLFWESFGIKISTLELFNVKPIKFLFINGIIYPVEKYAYAYKEIKDRQLSYKIYQPFSRNRKWINNSDSSTHQGYTLLPKNGELLVITKSLKDVMSLYDVANISAIAIQSESILIKQSVMDEYIDRFNQVVCLFDNDPSGNKLAIKYEEEYGIDSIKIPDKFKQINLVKDFSDLVKEYNINVAYNVINNLINEKRK